jgi:hypothetical protein
MGDLIESVSGPVSLLESVPDVLGYLIRSFFGDAANDTLYVLARYNFVQTDTSAAVSVSFPNITFLGGHSFIWFEIQ